MKIRLQLTIFVFLRTILNTAHRMVYPFLSVFARGLGVDIASMSLLMTARSLIGSASPLFAPIADRRGRKFGMLAGISIFTLGMGIVAIHPSYWTLAAALILAVLGKYMFDPAMQAYFGDRIPYEQRGTALAVTEMAWSMAFIIGVPAMGFLISKFSWSAPFPVLAALGALVFFIIWRIIPHEDEHHEPVANSREGYSAVFKSIPALAGISIAMWASAGNELVNVIFGVWLEDSFGLKIAALAGASAVIGISELSGEGLVALTTDRLGKPLALTIGLVGNAVASLLLPIIGTTQIGALIGLFFFYITFEYIMVSHIPMMTELVPSARATMLSLNVTGHAVGRALGAFLAAIIYQRFGFVPVALLAVIFNIAGLLALKRMQRQET
ncbi:MAG TPA: MFS transporter, partial [Anaerolineales bacterium]|nr:MFS transporter [Anaerolineales bacterium]